MIHVRNFVEATFLFVATFMGIAMLITGDGIDTFHPMYSWISQEGWPVCRIYSSIIWEREPEIIVMPLAGAIAVLVLGMNNALCRWRKGQA